jgi:ADP-heptose:LPS heptosyltransferase
VQSIAILRLRSLGDCVLTTPAISILKQWQPKVRVAVVVEDRFRAVFEGNPDIDVILPPKIGMLRDWKPEYCLNLHGGTRSAQLTALSGAWRRAGFAHYRNQMAYNIRIPRAQEILRVERKVHTAEHLASAMFFLGAPKCEVPRAKLFGRADTECPPHIAVIHATAATPEKSWRADGFRAIAGHLQKTGNEPVFIGAAADNLSAFEQYRVIKGAPLAAIKNLMAGASLFVGNDSGPAHMAAAFGLPVAVIFKASDPDIWKPWRTASEVLIGDVDEVEAIAAVDRLRVRG